MRTCAVFSVLLACSAPTKPSPPPQLPPPRVAPLVADAQVAPPALVVGKRGSTCSPEHACDEGMLCLPMPRGYCGSFCGITGSPCDGSCVETARAGEICFAHCTSDADCRASEGYICDPQWKACMVPNLAAIVPPRCPASGGRDPAFGPVDVMSTSKAPGIYQFEPSGALTNDGGITALYIARGSMLEGNPLGVARLDGKGTATLDVPLSSDRATHFDPWVARDRKGTLYAVWLEYDGRGDKNQQIALSTSTDAGATWSKPIAAHDPVDCKDGERDCLDKPMIAIGPDPLAKQNDIIYVMYAAGESGLRVRASRDGGKTFTKAAIALDGIYGNAAVGADGRLHVVTLNGSPMGAFGSADHKIEYAVSSDAGAHFTKAQTISGRDELLPFFFANPSIALDDKRGWLYIAYTRGGRDGKWDLVITASKDKGKTWKHTTIGDGCSIHMVPNLALDPTTGTLHVAWYDSTGGGRYAHATCPAGAPTCTVAGAINSAPFAALSLERHGSKWIGEYETLVVDDKRRVLHAMWTQPVDEGGKAVARIFHAAAKLR